MKYTLFLQLNRKKLKILENSLCFSSKFFDGISVSNGFLNSFKSVSLIVSITQDAKFYNKLFKIFGDCYSFFYFSNSQDVFILFFLPKRVVMNTHKIIQNFNLNFSEACKIYFKSFCNNSIILEVYTMFCEIPSTFIQIRCMCIHFYDVFVVSETFSKTSFY